jgi:putative membrane protein
MMFFHPLGGFSWLILLIPIGFWISLLALIVWIVSRVSSTRPSVVPPTPSPSLPHALEILRERYARGEIDAETFQQMETALRNSYRRE